MTLNGVIENTPDCTTWWSARSAPATRGAVLGLPPGWYKSPAYRSRAVLAPRAVLAEFGLALEPARGARLGQHRECATWCCPSGPRAGERVSEDELAGW